MRTSCRYCTLKHIGSAMVIAEEIANGHLDPTHVSLMIGHLGQAESQSQERWPEIAQTLRKIRQNAEENYWNALDMRKTSCALETDLAYVANRLADLTAPIPLPESASGPGPVGQTGIPGIGGTENEPKKKHKKKKINVFAHLKYRKHGI